MPQRPTYLHAAQLMIRRDLAARTRGTVLGWLWLLIQPLFLLAVYTLVFGALLGVRFPGTSSTGGFALYLFAALVPFGAFQEGVLRGGSSLVDDPNSLKNLSVPPLLIPLVPVAASAVTEMAGLLVLMIWALLRGSTPSPWLLLLPLLMTVRLGGTLALAWLLSVLAVVLRDLRQVTAMLLLLAFFATPIIYPSELVPEHWAWVYRLNPFYYLVESYRDVLLRGRAPPSGFWLLALAVPALGYVARRFFNATVHRVKDLL